MLWGLRQVEPRATYGLAVDLLRRQIHSGLLLPLEKLPAERQLSDQFGISRVTLREALRVLETDQYVTIRRGAQGGAFVTDEDRLRDLAKRRMLRAPASTMRALEFLSVNQLAAARFAAVRRGPAEVKRMRQALALLSGPCTAPQVKQAEALFFLALGDASHNPLLARAIEDALAELFLPFEQPGTPCQAGEVFEDLDALCAAVEHEQPEAAEAAVARHHDRLWAGVRRLIRKAA